MKLVNDFLMKERESIGWRFWILFIVMTNIGFFAGLALESLLFGEINVYIGTAMKSIHLLSYIKSDLHPSQYIL